MESTHYVIVTPAHNEEAFYEKTIHSMVAQTVLPLKWIVVNDGSVDRTTQIVESLAKHREFIQLENFILKDFVLQRRFQKTLEA